MNAARHLQAPVLVLNKFWSAIQTSTVQEAICLVAKGSARIIEPGTFAQHDLDSWHNVSKAKAAVAGMAIRSLHLALCPPEVILLTIYEGQGERSVVFSRRNLFKRDRYTCQFCGKQPGPEELTIDHVLPKSHGGKSTWENCVLACVGCNKRKADRSPEQAKMPLRKVPKKPSWRALTQIPSVSRRESWAHFISRSYWEVELEAE
jgi:5-methylcytosine-specific restriction endonuclease McrA